MSADNADSGQPVAPPPENPTSGFDKWVADHGNGPADPRRQALPGLIEVRKQHLVQHPDQVWWSPKGASSSAVPEPPLPGGQQVSNKGEEVALEQRIAEQLKSEEEYIRGRMEQDEELKKAVLLHKCMWSWVEQYGDKEYTANPERMALPGIVAVRQRYLRDHPEAVLVPEDFPFAQPNIPAPHPAARSAALLEKRIAKQIEYEEAHVGARMQADTFFSTLVDSVVVNHPENPRERRASQPDDAPASPRVPSHMVKGRRPGGSQSPIASPRGSVSQPASGAGGSDTSSPRAAAGTEGSAGGSPGSSPHPPASSELPRDGATGGAAADAVGASAQPARANAAARRGSVDILTDKLQKEQFL